jgi:DNA-binding NarL/FixJ family response regulator
LPKRAAQGARLSTRSDVSLALRRGARCGTDERPRIWIDTRNAIFRQGLAGCIGDSCTIAGESAALEPQPELDAVDVLLFDFELLPAAIALAGSPSTLLVALVPTLGQVRMPAVVEAGLAGFLVRADLVPQELRRCLDTILGGGRWYPSPRMVPGTFRRPAHDRLTAREVAVLRLLADGSRTTEIARSLSYSERMVKNIVHDVMTKMECRTRAQAVAVVVREGVI